MSPHWMDECYWGKVNLKIEIEVLEMGIIFPTKEAHFVFKSICYGEILKHHNCQEKLKGIKQNFKIAIQLSVNIRAKNMSEIKGDTTT